MAFGPPPGSKRTRATERSTRYPDASPPSALIRREFSAYFLSPIAYVVIAVFLVVHWGNRFYLTMEQLTARAARAGGPRIPMQFMVGDLLFWLVFLFIPRRCSPCGLFAEEAEFGALSKCLLNGPPSARLADRVREVRRLLRVFTS